MSIQLIKKRFGRRRFVKTQNLLDPLDWQSELSKLKDWLASQSHFQQVGPSAYLEVEQGQISLKLEVIGLPMKVEQNGLILVDAEAPDVLIYNYPNEDIFSLDLPAIHLTAQKIMDSLNRGEGKVIELYDIALEEEKIALHFFRQKDYSQKLL